MIPKTEDQLTEADKQAIYARDVEYVDIENRNMADAVTSAAFDLHGLSIDPQSPGMVTLQTLADTSLMTQAKGSALLHAAAIGRFYD